MHRLLANECRLTGTLTSTSPVLVRSAVETIGGPDVGVVLTVRDGMDQPYLPGSTLKGALRSQSERLLRTLRPGTACNPVDDRGPARSCGRRIEERERDPQRPERRLGTPPATVYRDSCAACKTFGSSALAGRVLVADAPLRAGVVPALVRRDGIGIDRFSGAASLRSHYELEAVTDVSFDFAVTLTNFETWQLGLVGLALQDLLTGRLPLGSSKARGLGQVRGTIESIEVGYVRGPRIADAGGALLGVGSLIEDGGRYGYREQDRIAMADAAPVEDRGLRRVVRYPTDSFPWEALTEDVIGYVEQVYRPSPWFGRDGEGEEADGARTR